MRMNDSSGIRFNDRKEYRLQSGVMVQCRELQAVQVARSDNRHSSDNSHLGIIIN